MEYSTKQQLLLIGLSNLVVGFVESAHIPGIYLAEFETLKALLSQVQADFEEGLDNAKNP